MGPLLAALPAWLGGAAAAAGEGAAIGSTALGAGATALGEGAALGGSTALGLGEGLGLGTAAALAGEGLTSAAPALMGGGGSLLSMMGPEVALPSMAPALMPSAVELAGSAAPVAAPLAYSGDMIAAMGAQNFSIPELLHGSMLSGWNSMGSPTASNGAMMPAPTGSPTQALPGAATPRPDLAQLSGIEKLLQQYSQPDQVVSALVGGQKMLMQNRAIKAQEMAGNRASSSAPNLRSSGGNSIPVKVGGGGARRPSPLEAYALLLRGAGK